MTVYIYKEDELKHHGVKGMKWGVRRYQNADGTLTEAGKKRTTRQAKRILKKMAIPLQKKDTRYYKKTYERYTKKENKALDKAHDAAKAGNIKKTHRYLRKSGKIGLKTEKYLNAYLESDKYQKWMQTKLSDIDSGKIAAGKDYVTKIDRFLGTTDYSIEFLSKKEPYKSVGVRQEVRPMYIGGI